MPPSRKGRMFFFEKKNQKTFATLARCSNVRHSWRHPNEKSFLVLFFKKEQTSFLTEPGDRRVFPPENASAQAMARLAQPSAAGAGKSFATAHHLC
jgi:hypothetical protein